MTNNAAIGFAIMAAKKSLGLDGDKLVQLIYAMRREMDEHIDEEAEEVYQNT